MRSCFFLILISWAPPALAQLQPGDLLLNSIQGPDVLVHYRPDGTIVQTAWPGTGTLWIGAAILPNGNWVTTRRGPNDGVNIFDPATGAEIATWDLPAFSGVTGDVGVFSDGTLVIADNGGTVWHLDTAGNVISSWGVSASPFGILVDDRDHVWTCDFDTGVLWHTDELGNKVNEFPTGDLAGDATMADDGTLFVTHYLTGDVVHYTQDGVFLGRFQGTAAGELPYGIAMGLDQSLWVSGMWTTLIRNFDQSGTLLGSIDVGPAAQPLFLTIPHVSEEDMGTRYCGPANLNSSGQSAVISAFGNTQATFNMLRLTASQLPPNVFGYFLNSDVQAFTPFPPGSLGNLCLGGGIGRHVKQTGNSGAAGELVIDVDLTNLPRPNGSHSVMAGETWNFQCWFRDNNGGPTSNFTDGIEIQFE